MNAEEMRDYILATFDGVQTARGDDEDQPVVVAQQVFQEHGPRR